jgi:hypothetical protein
MRIIIICTVFVNHGSRAVNSVNRPFFSNQTGYGVRLQMSAIKLIELFENGNLHVEDFRCLDPCSKDLVRRLLLSVSVNTDRHVC